MRSGFFPLDDVLGLLPGDLTPRLQEGLGRLSTQIPSFAKAMLALRNAICSERWEKVWSEIEQEQRQQHRWRRLERQRRRRQSAVPETREVCEAEVGVCRQPGKHDGGRARPVAPSDRPTEEKRRPAASHPWRKAWSLRRQRQIASTA